MRSYATVVAAVLALAPMGAQAADLVVWWEKGYYSQEDEAVREIIAAFEQGSGKQVELDFHPQEEFSGEIVAALQSGAPPDFAFGLDLHEAQWAFDDRLIDLSEAVGQFSNLFDGDALDRGTLLNAEDRTEGPVRATDGPFHQSTPRVEKPSRPRGLQT